MERLRMKICKCCKKEREHFVTLKGRKGPVEICDECMIGIELSTSYYIKGVEVTPNSYKKYFDSTP